MDQSEFARVFNSEAEALRIYSLIEGFNNGSLSDVERKELDAWILNSQENTDFFAELTK